MDWTNINWNTINDNVKEKYFDLIYFGFSKAILRDEIADKSNMDPDHHLLLFLFFIVRAKIVTINRVATVLKKQTNAIIVSNEIPNFFWYAVDFQRVYSGLWQYVYSDIMSKTRKNSLKLPPY